MILTPENAQALLIASLTDIHHAQTQNTVRIAAQTFGELIQANEQARERITELEAKCKEADIEI